MQIPLRPFPLDPSAGDSLETFFESGRSWEGALDPGQNEVAAAVVGKMAADKGKAVRTARRRRGGDQVEHLRLVEQKLQVPDRSVYLCGFDHTLR